MSDLSWCFPSHALQNQGTQFNFYFYWFVISTGWQCLTRLCNLTLLLFLPLPFCRNMLLQLKTTKQIHLMSFGWHHLKRKRKKLRNKLKNLFSSAYSLPKGEVILDNNSSTTGKCAVWHKFQSRPFCIENAFGKALQCGRQGMATLHSPKTMEEERMSFTYFADFNNSLRSSLIAPSCIIARLCNFAWPHNHAGHARRGIYQAVFTIQRGWAGSSHRPSASHSGGPQLKRILCKKTLSSHTL